MKATGAPDLPERWILQPVDRALVMSKHPANRLSFAMLLIFFRHHGRFPRSAAEIDPAVIRGVAGQIAEEPAGNDSLTLSGRTVERHRAEICALLGFRETTLADADGLEAWLQDQIAAAGADAEPLTEMLEARCREIALEPPSADRTARIVRAAIRAHEERLYAGILERLTPQMRSRLGGLLHAAGNVASDSGDSAADRSSAAAPACSCNCAPARGGRISPALRANSPSWS